MHDGGSATPMDFSMLSEIRAFELSRVRSIFPPGSKVLEVGAGAGWQAQALAEAGFEVSAIDIESGGYEGQRVWPVQDYDGVTIPFPDESFDVVFSSNVLEHIPHVEVFQAELLRVLRPAGRAVHVLPTGSWRFWTSLSHYAYLGQLAAQVLRPRSQHLQATLSRSHRLSAWQKVQRVVIPPRHGEIGSSLSEVYLFSRFRWRRLFERTGWRIEDLFPAGLLYTGYNVVGSAWTVPTRQRLSRVLGSSCLVYVLRKR